MKITSIVLAFLIAFALSIKVSWPDEKKTFSVKFIGTPEPKNSYKSYRVCQIISNGETQQHRIVTESIKPGVESPIYVTKMPQQLEHGIEADPNGDYVVEVFGTSYDMVMRKVSDMCVHIIREQEPEYSEDEVFKLHYSGDPQNRIDIVFMGDGYTSDEKEIFLGDMKRLHNEMFAGITFGSYLPLFNVWAIFRPSKESGIGTHGKPKDTAYKLYRQGTELRGVYCANPSAARDSCKKTGQYACDFPTIIGNSPYYGGLGGEFTISTSSPTSGTVVLRHEMGHTHGNIGEEYDSGSYFGANYASSLSQAKSKWGPWITGALEAQQSVIRVHAYPWYDLANGPKEFKFKSDGKYKRWRLYFSVSGCETQDAIKVSIDGNVLPWKTTGLLDRGFHQFVGQTGFTAGEHVLRFEQVSPPNEMPRQLCNLYLIEYMGEDKFKWSDEYINAYPLFGPMGGFRSQHEKCLMRNMTSEHFCNVCKENLWLQYFQKVSAIDGISVNEVNATHIQIKAEMIKIGQFREGGPRNGERFTCSWTINGHRIDLDDKFDFVFPKSAAKGTWELTAKYLTPEVRSDPRNLLQFKKKVNIA